MPISHAIKKYGKENFKIEVLKECSSTKELDVEERKLADELNTWSPNGYNLKAGKGRGSICEASRRNMSIGWHKRSDLDKLKERMSKVGASMKGKKRSKEHIEKITKLRRLRDLRPSDKCLQAAVVSHQKSRIVMFPGGEVVEIPNLYKFCREVKIHPRNLYSVLNTGKPCKRGFRWWNKSFDGPKIPI